MGYFKENGLEIFYNLIKDKFIKSSETNKEQNKKNLNSINFGVSVLNWLRFDEQPFFANLKDEILHNPHSTINEELYNEYIEICKIKIANNPHFKLKEMLSLKLYSDCTAFTSALRHAHWKSFDENDIKNKNKCSIIGQCGYIKLHCFIQSQFRDIPKKQI